MKVACVTDDGKIISQHFGRAPYYAVVTIEDGLIIERELRDKVSHMHVPSKTTAAETGIRRGTDPTSHSKHQTMAEIISDCEALLCRGMGYGAYESMQKMGITPVVTDQPDVDSAVLAYAAGDLEDHTELLH